MAALHPKRAALRRSSAGPAADRTPGGCAKSVGQFVTCSIKDNADLSSAWARGWDEGIASSQMVLICCNAAFVELLGSWVHIVLNTIAWRNDHSELTLESQCQTWSRSCREDRELAFPGSWSTEAGAAELKEAADAGEVVGAAAGAASMAA